MESNNTKEIKLENDEEGIDRISKLPDSTLTKILCNLPTKNAVGTSILSTRWKNISPFVVAPFKLDLDDSLLLNPNREENNNDNNTPSVSFTNFVDKLFNVTLSNVPCLEELILKCEKSYGDAKIVSWVCAALRLNVRHLDLKVTLNESITLFRSLNGCKTLVALRLLVESELRLPDNFTLPNLKILDLNKLIFNNDEGKGSINRLIEGCPALEYLYFSLCDLKCLRVLCIRCPQLKNLVIEVCWHESTCELVLDVPNLEILIYVDVLASRYSVRLPESLHTAHIDLGPNVKQYEDLDKNKDDEALWYYEDVVKFVSTCSGTVHLYLSCCVIDCLNRTLMQLQVFQNLTWLSLGCLGLKWAILARLLLNAPNLERLTMEEEFLRNEGEFAKFKNLLPITPKCLELRLKKIEIWVFEGSEDEMKLVEYFLKNGEVLQELILHCLPPRNGRFLRRLLMLPRQSVTCQIDCRPKLR